MKELSKSIVRRMADANFGRRWFVGAGIDIGGKPDPLSLYGPFFPLMGSVRTWDWEDGDAQILDGVAPESQDFIHSSHCLEHLVDPVAGLKAWFAAIRPGGFTGCTVMLLPPHLRKLSSKPPHADRAKWIYKFQQSGGRF